ncbi:MAG: hypothetical protein HRU70_01260 [Phycisphaeraceae bacterium]|nr:MAG: hypothetical protein HRU70_01260 [Phycisphaeraceae bacterium]
MPKPALYFTFGNHMHWVDMQWLWGYDVLPGSVRDMIDLAHGAGVKGNVNFDAIGYEKMASESPEALARLKDAVASGLIEPVGCSYGQPYGLFHGGESNVRQLTFGARAVRRHLGVWPRAFWEEEFYFFPQLPQMLAGIGFTGACLFFQWTWHTPELPRESTSLVHWEGIDGSRLPALPRNVLNVHQWPEDFDGLLDRAGEVGPVPAVVQWVELMPTKDWMCRSEVLLPRLRALAGDPRFEVRAATVSGVIEGLRSSVGELPVRRYAMDQVWHGMTAGKNADRHPRESAFIERLIVEAEALSVLAGLIGRPYPSWDVYPTWELDEAWRELLSAQHHDNHECEGLCGFVGYHSMDRARALAEEVAGRTADLIGRRLGGEGSGGASADAGVFVVFNPLGWPAPVVIEDQDGNAGLIVEDVPPMSVEVVAENSPGMREVEPATTDRERHLLHLDRGEVRATIDTRAGTLVQIASEALGDGAIDASRPLFTFEMRRDKKTERFMTASVEIEEDNDGAVDPSVVITRGNGAGDVLRITVEAAPERHAVDARVLIDRLKRPDGGMNAGLRMPIVPAFKIGRVLADTPFAVGEVNPTATWKRKYPEGDWMTSPQWFEEVRRPFTSLSVVDLLDARGDGRGLLIAHDATIQWFRDDLGVSALLAAYDPWDEERHALEGAEIALRFIPHGPITHAQRVRLAREFLAPGRVIGGGAGPRGGDERSRGGLLSAAQAETVSGNAGVLIEACFRESMKAGEHLPRWAGHRMSAQSGGACDHPLVVRLVEWNGEPGRVRLVFPGTVALAAKTTALGEALDDSAWLDVLPSVGLRPGPRDRPHARTDVPGWSQVEFDVRAHEIVTVMADLVPARKQWRDLDAKREIWATVHRVEP